MPTYEYACTDCGQRIEVFQRLHEEPLDICDRCGGRLRKVFHPAGIVFRGSGFYATDSRAAAGRADGAKKESGEAKGDSKADSKAERAKGGSKPSSGEPKKRSPEPAP